MITTGSKFFYALAALLAFAAVVYGYATGGGNVGPLSVGYKGGVGDILGYGMFVSGATLSLFLGLVQTAFRDADPDVDAEMIGVSTLAAASTPGTSYWPIVGAFGVGLTVVGAVLNNVFFVAGLIALGAVAIEWTVQTWADRATGDPAVNREIRNRIMLPLEVPLAAALAIAVVVVGYSRVFLTLSAENAVWAALVIAVIVFGVGTLLGSKEKIRTDVIAGLLVVGAVTTIGLGIFGALNGERDFHHEPEAGEAETHAEDGEDAETHSDGAETPATETDGGDVVEESN